MEKIINQMKKDLDSLYQIPLSDYQELFGYLHIRAYAKNTIIKSHKEVDTNGYYILDGIVGLYEQLKQERACTRLFTETDVFFDIISYRNQKITSIEFIAYTDCLVCELPMENEEKLMDEMPEFIKLGYKLGQRVSERDHLWRNLLSVIPEKAYKDLQEIFPHIGMIRVRDLSTILKVSERTLYRIRALR